LFVITGSTGVGKSFLACANGYKVIYLNAIKLFQELKLSKNDGSYIKIINRI